MINAKFDLPIVVEPRWGRPRVVSSAREAGELLLREWPNPECLKRKKAMSACLSAIRGDTKPAGARKAFLEAAKAAGIIRSKSETSLTKAKAATAGDGTPSRRRISD